MKYRLLVLLIFAIHHCCMAQNDTAKFTENIKDPKLFGYRISGGGGAILFGGKLSVKFAGNYLVNFPTFELSYGRHSLGLGIGIGGARAKSNFESDARPFSKGDRCSITSLDIPYSYSLFNSSAIKITPLIGFRVMYIAHDSIAPKGEKIVISSFTTTPLILGASLDLKFSSESETFYTKDWNETSASALRLMYTLALHSFPQSFDKEHIHTLTLHYTFNSNLYSRKLNNLLRRRMIVCGKKHATFWKRKYNKKKLPIFKYKN